MKISKNLQFSNKFWTILFTVAALICGITICLFRVFHTGNTAVISKDGKELYTINLSLVSEPYTIPIDGNIVLVENGKISMQSANCPDKLCVHQGVIKTHGRIVCLPNRVMIEIVNGKDVPDAKVG